MNSSDVGVNEMAGKIVGRPPKNIQEEYWEGQRNSELWYNTFFEICRKYSIQWSKATEKDRDFVTEMTRVTYQNRIGVPKEQIHFFGPRI